MNDIEKYDYIKEIYGNSYFDNIDVVLKLLSDTDECVRIEMIEACYACEQKLIQNRLFQMLKNVKGLEKGYLFFSNDDGVCCHEGIFQSGCFVWSNDDFMDSGMMLGIRKLSADRCVWFYRK